VPRELNPDLNLNVLHQRLLQDVLAIGNAFPLVLTGGYAVQAHGLVERLSRDLDVATNSDFPMASIAAALIDGLTRRGWEVEVIGIDPLSARLVVTDPRAMMSSVSSGSRTVSTARSGTTIRHSPNTASRRRTLRACVDGRRHGPTTSGGGSTEETSPRTITLNQRPTEHVQATGCGCSLPP
jgi:hypothetical protein